MAVQLVILNYTLVVHGSNLDPKMRYLNRRKYIQKNQRDAAWQYVYL